MQTINYFLGLIIGSMILNGCVGVDLEDDLVPERLVIENPVVSLKVGESHQFNATFWNNVGLKEDLELVWESSNDQAISITREGIATAISDGNAVITVAVNEGFDVFETITVSSGDETVEVEMSTSRMGALRTTSSYVLEGDFSLVEENGALELIFEDNFRATSALPGLYVYLTNNPSTINGALELGPVTKFSGSISYSIPGTVQISEYNYVLMFCKPFVIKVGDGEFQN